MNWPSSTLKTLAIFGYRTDRKSRIIFIGNLGMYWRHARIYSLNMAISASFYFPSKCGEFEGFFFPNVRQVCDWTPNTLWVFDWVYIYIYKTLRGFLTKKLDPPHAHHYSIFNYLKLDLTPTIGKGYQPKTQVYNTQRGFQLGLGLVVV